MNTAPVIPLWYAPDWLRWILGFVMLPAFVLFFASVSGRKPTMIGGENAVAEVARGIQRITRHPREPRKRPAEQLLADARHHPVAQARARNAAMNGCDER